MTSDLFIIFGSSNVIWQFVEYDDFIAVCCASRKIYEQMDYDTIAFYTIPSQYRNNYLKVCTRGIIPNKQILMDHNTIKNDVLRLTIKKHHCHVVEWLLNKFRFNINPVDIAAQYGFCDILHMCRKNKKGKFTQHTLDVAAACGHLNVVEWLHLNVPEIWNTCNPIIFASREGHYDVVNWLLENTNVNNTPKAMDGACQNGHFEIVKLLHKHKMECTAKAMDYACKTNNFEMVKWLHENRTDGCNDKGVPTYAYGTCTKDALNNACENGNFEIACWLHENRMEGCTQKAMMSACKNGHTDIVKWLYNTRKEVCTSNAAVLAISNGHIDLAKWLYTNVPACKSKSELEYGIVIAQQKKYHELVLWIRKFSQTCYPI